MDVHYSSTAVGIWCYECSLLLNCCGHMMLWMFITAQLLWAYGVTNVHCCSTYVGICCVTRRRVWESNGTNMEQGDRKFWFKRQKVKEPAENCIAKTIFITSTLSGRILVLLRWGRWGVNRGMSNWYKISVLRPQGSTPYVSCRS
jgi:hypothetical protein